MAQKRIDDNKEEDDTSRVVVINNGTGVQVIVLPENEDKQERLLTKQNYKKCKTFINKYFYRD